MRSCPEPNVTYAIKVKPSLAAATRGSTTCPDGYKSDAELKNRHHCQIMMFLVRGRPLFLLIT